MYVYCIYPPPPKKNKNKNKKTPQKPTKLSKKSRIKRRSNRLLMVFTVKNDNKKPKNLPNCLKSAELSVVLVV
jgi:hypothetical protein